MLSWTVTFFLMSLLAGLLTISGLAIGLAKIFLAIFLVLFVLSVFFHFTPVADDAFDHIL